MEEHAVVSPLSGVLLTPGLLAARPVLILAPQSIHFNHNGQCGEWEEGGMLHRAN